MSRPRPQRSPTPISNIAPHLYRLIPELTPGPLGYNDAFDANLHWTPDWSVQLQLMSTKKSPFAHLHLLSKQDWDELYAQPEFNLLKGHISDKTVREYVARRTQVFGSTRLYEAFGAISDQELDDTPGLRKLIEMGGKSQREQMRQAVFYRWVRKAYIDKGVDNVPALIKAGMSENLQKALKKVRISSGSKFKAGGFNPRPQKNSAYQYILGTISDHAFGTAVDIEDASNPILSPREWRFLETFTGKKVNRANGRWKTKPEELWKDIKAVNDLFVAKLPEAVNKMDQQLAWTKATHALETALQLPPPDLTGPARGKEYHLTDKTLTLNKATQELQNRTALDWVLAGVPKLKQYTKGFFTLEWALVKELHAHDFTWGATFPNVDLHHFELEEKMQKK
jgi:hypothetical protein